MAEQSILREKAEDLAIRIVKAAKYLVEDRHELIMSRQMLRSGTSIGANITEGIYAQSRKDFVNKLSISLKEATETCFWLRLLHKTSYISDAEYKSIIQDVEEVIRLLISTIKTTKANGLK